MSTQYVLGAIAIAILAAGWLALSLADRAQAAKARRAAEVWRAANPPGPPITPAELEELRDWLAAETLPAILLHPADAPILPGGTRIGGPAWLPDGTEWPLSRDGRPMEFIAQLDFGELPRIPDFPEAGLLQFFIAQDDLYGADLDQPERGDIRLIWQPEIGPGRMIAPPPEDDATFSPLDPAARLAGVPLSGSVAAIPPTIEDWRVTDRLMRPGADDFAEERHEASLGFMVHHVGGHPAYTQWDFRSADRCADVDRTLLRLTSDKTMMWGDVGEAAFTIRREDLLARRFDRAIFWWDCH
jgi:uncharacterized protein YwqG